MGIKWAFARDAQGWPVYPMDGANLIHVDRQSGNDKNSGDSPDKAIRTLAAIPVKRQGGRVNLALLRRGQVWNEPLPSNINGDAPDKPFIVTSYGDASEQPLIVVKGRQGWAANGRHCVTLHDLAFLAEGRTKDQPVPFNQNNAPSVGVEAYGCDYLSVVGCTVKGFRVGISAQTGAKMVRFRQFLAFRNTVLDSWTHGTNDPARMHAQGIYAHRVDGALIAENVFDHCGYLNNSPDSTEPEAGGDQTIYNHSMYLTGECVNLDTYGNLSTRPSAFGMQQRCGGDAECNVFMFCPTGMEWGLVDGGGPCFVGGVTGTVRYNVVIGGDDIGKVGDRGIAFKIGNVKEALWLGNLAALDTQKSGHYAYQLIRNTGVYQADSVGVNNLTLERCFVARWEPHLIVDPNLKPGGQGFARLSNVRSVSCNFKSNNNAGSVAFSGSAPNFPDAATVERIESRAVIKAARKLAGPRAWNNSLLGPAISRKIMEGFGVDVPSPNYGGGPPVDPPPVPETVDVTILLRKFDAAAKTVETIVADVKDGQAIAMAGFALEARVPTNAKVEEVIFSVDGKGIHGQTNSPYYFGGDRDGVPIGFDAWAPGSHKFTAGAYRGGKSVGETTVTMNVLAGSDPPPAPPPVDPPTSGPDVATARTEASALTLQASSMRVQLTSALNAANGSKWQKAKDAVKAASVQSDAVSARAAKIVKALA